MNILNLNGNKQSAKNNKNILGARMMGGGFGGCTINIIKKEAVEDFLETATDAYQKKFRINPEVIDVKVGDGTHELH